MTSISDKLSASVRKAKAQTSEEAKPTETAVKPAAAAKATAPKRPAATRTAARSAPAKSSAKAAPAAKPAAPTASQDELFPTRVWPD